ncbi:alpha-tocopherol transfer protein-like [Epargyreus clarus]|uniref:alpha-tocopherol transfer protein-like n=1 Tax=Epargyreus clarus TaxID=520877 RepID=UPI003C2BA698
MPQDVTQDVNSIREWLAKEPHLPKDLDDFTIKKFLHSCYGSLERTKKCIDRFCTTRAQMSEIYTARDPFAPNLQTAFSITSLASYETDDSEILIHELDDPALEKFVFYDLLKTFCINADYWIKYHPCFPEGHIIILDLKCFSLRMIPKVNIMYFRDFILFLLEGMPVRVKKIYGVNAPSYYEKLYALVKPAIPAEVCEIISFYPDTASLHKVINKKYLPEEYGGDAPSMRKQGRDWVEKINTERKMFLNDDMWKADLRLKPKSNGDTAMSGSFRTLAID